MPTPDNLSIPELWRPNSFNLLLRRMSFKRERKNWTAGEQKPLEDVGVLFGKRFLEGKKKVVCVISSLSLPPFKSLSGACLCVFNDRALKGRGLRGQGKYKRPLSAPLGIPGNE